MTPAQLYDLRCALLRELYRVTPLGRTAARLCQIVQDDVKCDANQVDASLELLRGEGNVEPRQTERAAAMSPGLPPFWFITAAGMKFCEANQLV